MALDAGTYLALASTYDGGYPEGDYIFGVPEPSQALLQLSSIGLLAALLRVRRRRNSR